MDVYPSRSFACFICKATAISRQANGLSGPAVEEGLCPFVSTEIEVRRDLAARHVVDCSSDGPGITMLAYETLNGPEYNIARSAFKAASRNFRYLDEQNYLWQYCFQCFYRPPEQWSNFAGRFVSSGRYIEYFDSPTHAKLWLMNYCPVLLTRPACVIDFFGVYEPSTSTAFTIEMKQEPEDELKFVSIETTSLDERVWTAPRYSVEPRFYSHLSVEQTSHVQNEDINSSRRTDELDHFTRPRGTNELTSPACLRLSNELHDNITMGSPGRSPAPLINASPGMSNALLYDLPSATRSPAPLIKASPSMRHAFLYGIPSATGSPALPHRSHP